VVLGCKRRLQMRRVDVAHEHPCPPRRPCRRVTLLILRRSSARRGAGARTRRRPWKRPGMARRGPRRACRRRQGAALTDGESTASPSRRRAEPREAEPRRSRRRPAGPSLGLAKIRKVGAQGCGGEGIIRR
jgi:hypothetical protein